MHIRVLSIKRGRKAWDFIPMIIIFSIDVYQLAYFISCLLSLNGAITTTRGVEWWNSATVQKLAICNSYQLDKIIQANKKQNRILVHLVIQNWQYFTHGTSLIEPSHVYNFI